jgi:hypothetical protein
VSRVWPELELDPERIAQIAAHIADFSLAGLAGVTPKRKK